MIPRNVMLSFSQKIIISMNYPLVDGIYKGYSYGCGSPVYEILNTDDNFNKLCKDIDDLNLSIKVSRDILMLLYLSLNYKAIHFEKDNELAIRKSCLNFILYSFKVIKNSGIDDCANYQSNLKLIIPIIFWICKSRTNSIDQNLRIKEVYIHNIVKWLQLSVIQNKLTNDLNDEKLIRMIMIIDGNYWTPIYGNYNRIYDIYDIEKKTSLIPSGHIVSGIPTPALGALCTTSLFPINKILLTRELGYLKFDYLYSNNLDISQINEGFTPIEKELLSQLLNTK